MHAGVVFVCHFGAQGLPRRCCMKTRVAAGARRRWPRTSREPDQAWSPHCSGMKSRGSARQRQRRTPSAVAGQRSYRHSAGEDPVRLASCAAAVTIRATTPVARRDRRGSVAGLGAPINVHPPSDAGARCGAPREHRADQSDNKDRAATSSAARSAKDAFQIALVLTDGERSGTSACTGCRRTDACLRRWICRERRPCSTAGPCRR